MIFLVFCICLLIAVLAQAPLPVDGVILALTLIVAATLLLAKWIDTRERP